MPTNLCREPNAQRPDAADYAMEATSSRLARLATSAEGRGNLITGDPDDLAKIDWSREWKPGI